MKRGHLTEQISTVNIIINCCQSENIVNNTCYNVNMSILCVQGLQYSYDILLCNITAQLNCTEKQGAIMAYMQKLCMLL